MEKQTVVIYHACCADGFASAYASWTKFGDTAEYIPARHGDEVPDIKNKDVYLLDYCYSEDMFISMLADAKSITVIDHHISNQMLLERLENRKLKVVFNNAKSAAVLCWEYFCPSKEIPRLFLHIQDRDLWKKELEFTDEVISGLFYFEWNFELFQMYLDDVNELIEVGTIIENVSNREVKGYLNKVRYEYFFGYQVPVVNAPPKLASKIGHELAKDNAFAVIYFDTADKRVYSLRSSDEGVDVSKLAQSAGGGGHRCAAGFSTELDFKLDKLEILNPAATFWA
jgi:uncharacterized protein